MARMGKTAATPEAIALKLDQIGRDVVLLRGQTSRLADRIRRNPSEPDYRPSDPMTWENMAYGGREPPELNEIADKIHSILDGAVRDIAAARSTFDEIADGRYPRTKFSDYIVKNPKP